MPYCMVLRRDVRIMPGDTTRLRFAYGTVEADDRPDGIGLRLISAQPLEQAAEKLGKRLEIEAESESCLKTIQGQLKAGDGQIIFVVSRDKGHRQYEIELPGRFRVSPELAGGIKSLAGVVDVRMS